MYPPLLGGCKQADTLWVQPCCFRGPFLTHPFEVPITWWLLLSIISSDLLVNSLDPGLSPQRFSPEMGLGVADCPISVSPLYSPKAVGEGFLSATFFLFPWDLKTPVAYLSPREWSSNVSIGLNFPLQPDCLSLPSPLQGSWPRLPSQEGTSPTLVCQPFVSHMTQTFSFGFPAFPGECHLYLQLGRPLKQACLH